MLKTLHILFAVLLISISLNPVFSQSTMAGCGGITTTLTQCGGTFLDPGGAGNYANGSNCTETICPGAAGQCVTIQFTAFNIENNYDFLKIYNGSVVTPGALLATYTGTTVPAQVTSTTGCLTLVFTSDGIVNSTGWTANIICTACGSPPPPPPGPIVASDCSGAVNVCTNASFQVDPSGSGAIVEFTAGTISDPATNPGSANSGCLLTGESNSTWMVVNVASTGTLEFSIGADNGTGCLDWIMWPYTSNAVTCNAIINNTLAPIRCNWNGACEAFTGMSTPLPAGGAASNFEPELNVTCGQKYLICLSNYSSVSTSLPLNFLGTATISCTTFTPVTVNNATICPGASAVLTATGATTYTWSPATGLSATTGASVTASPAATTVYTVTGVGPCGTGTATSTVTVLPAGDPSCVVCAATATNTGPYCAGATVQLNGTGGGTYSWVGPNGFVSALQNPTIPAATTAASGTYTLTITSGACTATATTVVTVNALPVIAVPNQTVCAGTAVTLTGNGATTYTWTGGITNGVAFTPAATTTYTVTGTITATGCTNTDPATITVNPLPVIAVPNQTVCAGTAVTLSGNGATTYTWTGGITNGVAFTPAATTTYTVTGTITATGCTSTDPATITVNPLPIVNAGVDQTVCAGTAVTLSGSGATTYTWNNGVTNGVAFTPAATTTYTVTGTITATGCLATDQVIVTVNPLPIVNAGPDVSICTGGSTTLTATGATTYTWTGGITNGVAFSPAATTTYTVTGTTLGCTATDAVTVTVLANAPINAGVDATICIGGSTTLTATGGTTYTWNNGLGIGNNFSVSPAVTTTYTVVGTNAAGCTGTDAMTVTVNPLPIVNAGVDQTVCAGTAVTITATGATTYTWNNGVTNGVAFTPAATTTYTVTGTTLGCTNTDQVIVTVNPLPIVNAGIDQTVCAGTAVTLTGSGATTYTWNNGVSNGVAFTPAATTTYTVTGTTLGCINTDQVVVTVNPLPIVNAGADQTVCSGTSVTLNGAGASTYTWNNGITNGIAFTPAVGAITYTVTGTTAAGCIGTDQVIVTVNPNPAPIINGPSTYCAGNSALLSTSIPFTTYLWSTGAATATINATVANNPITVTVTNAFGCSGTSPVFTVTMNNVITANFTNTICQGQSSLIHGVNQTVAGVYSQTFILGTGCDSTSNVTLVVNPLPVVNAGVDQSVCTGVATTLTATGASTYSWNNAVVNGTPFTQAIGSVTYTVTGTSAAGCVNTDQVVVTVNPLPLVSAGPDQAVCAGTSVTLTGSGASTYTWNNGVTNAVAFTPVSTNSYTVTGTDINGCIKTDDVIVTINPLPIVGAGLDQTICIGASVTLSGSGASTYTWDNGVTNGVAFAPISTTTYTVTGTSVAGCIATDQVTVTVNPLPIVNAGIDQTICIGASVTLAGAGASTYTWNNGISNGIAFTPAVGTTTYTVTGTSAAGCINTDQVDVIVNPLPIVNAGIDQAVCAGTAVTLSASGANTYTWNNGVTDGVAFTPLATTTYTVTGTSVAGCINTDQVVVTVNPIPTVNAENDVVICAGATVTLTGSGANTYTWDNGVTNAVAFTPAVGTITYTVTGTSAFGCINTDQVFVTVNPIPVISFTPDVTIGCIPLTVNFTNTTVGSTNCVWTMSDGTVLNGCGTVANTFTMAGCYDITLTATAAGCTNSFTAIDLVCAEAPPVASFNPSSSVISELNPIVDFNNTTIGASTYVWNFGDNTPTSTTVNPTHDYSADDFGFYTVTLIAYSPLGCVDTATSVIQIVEELIFYVPNTFTPDEDNYNPVFKPIFTSGFDPYDYTLLIFNRWGEVVFESHNSEIGWNGTYGSNGEIELVQDGTYTWKIEFKVTKNDERKMVVGHVNIIR